MKVLFTLLTLVSITISANEKKLSLDDLGFDSKEITISPEKMAILNTRNKMLKWHQYTAFAALGAMTVAMVSGGHGKAKSSHETFGIAGGALYYTAASLALLAPEVDENHDHSKDSGSTKWHRRLAWIHGPMMILAPALGYLANEKYKKGQTPSGIAKNHSTFAKVGYFSFLAAAATMTFEF